jgi:hypothetical protein
LIAEGALGQGSLALSPPHLRHLLVRRIRFPRRFGFGRLFGLIFLVHHPVLLLVVAAVALAVYLVRRRR